MTAGVYLRRSKRPRLRGLIRFCFPRKIFSHRSAVADYKLWLINAAILFVLSPIIIGSGIAAYSGTLVGVRFLSGIDSAHLSVGPIAICLATAINLLALDLSLFVTHYASHRVPILWELHKVHHSAAVMTPITVFRVHPLELLFLGCAFALISNATSAFVVFLFGINPALAIAGSNVIEVAFYIAGYNLRHSHVWVMYPGLIGRHISSPALHLIHHSADPKHRDKNLGQIFTLWDRLAGTLYMPTQREKIFFGIGNGEDANYRTLSDFYWRPIANIARQSAAGGRRPPLRTPELDQ